PPASSLLPYTTLFRSDGPGEEPTSSRGVPARGEEHVDDLAELVDGPEQVAPGARDLQVGLVHAPPIPDDVLSGPGGLGELRGERSEEHTSELQSRENL